jgi:hypothetical protein
MSLRIRYSCPHCGRRILHHPELAGHLVICSACKGEFYEPTDPLPGKPAEKALEPMERPRRLRVPEGDNPRHDLAVLSRQGAGDMRTITEIVEAVLLDDDPPLPTPAPAGQSEPAPENVSETMHDFGYQLSGEEKPAAAPAIPSWRSSASQRKPSDSDAAKAAASDAAPKPAAPAARQAPAGPSLAGPAVRPLVPPSNVVPTAVVASPPTQRSIPKPAVPGAAPVKPTPGAELSRLSIKQMVEELRRRGLGVALVTCDMSPMRNFELAFSDNMTRDDALALVRRYLDTLREPKTPDAGGLLKRKWRKGEPE